MPRRIVLLLALVLAVPALATSPGQVYLDYHEALKRAVSVAEIWPYYLDSARAEFERKYPPELRGRVFYLMKSTSPNAVRVVEEKVSGDQATLTLRPVTEDTRMQGTAVLRLQAGEWKLESVVWQGR